MENQVYENHKFHINNAYFVPNVEPLSNEKEMNKKKAERKVTDHFHHDKGYKYDVEVPYDEKYPHVADRLGHPE